MTRMAKLMARLGLEVNAIKTRIARLPEEQFDFLGYTISRFYGRDGRPYIGTRPSKKAVKSLLKRIHGGPRVSGMRMTLPAQWLASAA
jgi:RNA-directed DNA polymerase